MSDLKFYEFGNVYRYNNTDGDVTIKYSETKKLSVFVTGKKMSESWYVPEGKVDHYFLKSLILAALRKTGIPMQKMIATNINENLFEQGEAFTISNQPFLSLGNLNQKLLKQFDIKQDVYYAEIDWNVLITEVKRGSVKFTEISRYPEVRRDLALLLDKNVKYADIETLAYKNGKGILRNVNLFDVYEGEKIEAGKKSYAVSFTLQDDQRTLTDNDIEKLMKRLTEVFEKELGAVIRK